MEKGILKLSKSTKGKIIVLLDKLNGKPPVPLTFVKLNSLELNDKICWYEMADRMITRIEVDGKQIYGVDPGMVRLINPSTNVNNSNNHRIYGFSDALNIRETRLPKAVTDLGNFNIDNFSLKFNKAARYIEDAPGKNKFFFFKNDRRTYNDGRQPSGHEFFIRPNYGNLNFDGIRNRQKNLVKSFFPTTKSEIIDFSPDWRLVCGLSGGIYETNMTLHHIYGVPYIPASSIKGVVRSWMITNIFGYMAPEDEREFPMINAEYRALKNSALFCDLFGTPESIEHIVFKDGKPEKKRDRNGKILDEYVKDKKESSVLGKESQGKVVFFEGLPVNPPQLMPDVINVHYQDWYKPEGFRAPTDFQSPVPIMFLTLTSESKFQLALGSHCDRRLNTWNGYEILAEPVGLDGNATLVDLAKKWVDLALTQHGIGAKTAVGYGYMKIE